MDVHAGAFKSHYALYFPITVMKNLTFDRKTGNMTQISCRFQQTKLPTASFEA